MRKKSFLIQTCSSKLNVSQTLLRFCLCSSILLSEVLVSGLLSSTTAQAVELDMPSQEELRQIIRSGYELVNLDQEAVIYDLKEKKILGTHRDIATRVFNYSDRENFVYLLSKNLEVRYIVSQRFIHNVGTATKIFAEPEDFTPVSKEAYQSRIESSFAHLEKTNPVRLEVGLETGLYNFKSAEGRMLASTTNSINENMVFAGIQTHLIEHFRFILHGSFRQRKIGLENGYQDDYTTAHLITSLRSQLWSTGDIEFGFHSQVYSSRDVFSYGVFTGVWKNFVIQRTDMAIGVKFLYDQVLYDDPLIETSTNRRSGQTNLLASFKITL